MEREYINWHLIISFIEQRWGLKKKDIAPILGYSTSVLSRKNPIQCDPEMAYARLFKLTATPKNESINSLASQHREDKSFLLEALEIFLRKSECIADADFIQASVKSQKKYEDIIPELLKRANMLSPKTKDSVKKECSKSTPSPSEQEPPASVADGDATPVSDKFGDTSPNTEVVVALDDTALPDTNRTESRTESGGAHLAIPDEYRRCAFCIRWKGNTSYAYKSKTGVPGTCKMYEREQISTDGIDCRYYEPDYGRINCKEIVEPMSFLLQ